MYWTYRISRMIAEIIRYDISVCRKMSAQFIGRRRLSMRQPSTLKDVYKGTYLKDKKSRRYSMEHPSILCALLRNVRRLNFNFCCTYKNKALKLLIFLEHAVNTIHGSKQLAYYMLFWNSAGFPRHTATKTVLAPAQILTTFSPYRPSSPEPLPLNPRATTSPPRLSNSISVTWN
jgi:hypothetical protein